MQHGTRNLTKDHVVLTLSEYLAEVKSQMVTPRKIKRNLKEEQQEIQSDCIPTLLKLTEVEKSKKENISIKVKETKRQIEEHIERVIAQFRDWKEETISDLEKEETIAKNVIDKIINDTEKQIDQLHMRCSEIDDTLKLSNSALEGYMCKNLHKNKPEPIQSSYKVSEFCPGETDKEQFQTMFGKPPSISLQ